MITEVPINRFTFAKQHLDEFSYYMWNDSLYHLHCDRSELGWALINNYEAFYRHYNIIKILRYE